MNTVNLIGRLTKDPELRYTANGTAVCSFTIAVNRQFKSEGQPEADFINCVAWKKSAEHLANYQKKGNQIGVTGRIQTRSYDGDNGKVFVTEVVAENVQFLDPKSSGGTKTENKAPQTKVNDDPFAGKGQIDIQDD
ncbi:MAG TPA: single-stranded DNA-binding protein, partial [Candidatus Saccharimonadales bacterium]|nr:single-stranded DNA-binding protein [Candidatus Saccharimonadales bacterium]